MRRIEESARQIFSKFEVNITVASAIGIYICLCDSRIGKSHTPTKLRLEIATLVTRHMAQLEQRGQTCYTKELSNQYVTPGLRKIHWQANSR